MGNRWQLRVTRPGGKQVPNWERGDRGRNAGYPAPPAQIRTCALTHTAPTFGG